MNAALAQIEGECEVSDQCPKVYFFGVYSDKEGTAIKVGFTTGSLTSRKISILNGQLSKCDLCLIAAVRGSRSDEKHIKEYFAQYRTDDNSTETFKLVPEIMEYLNWLRQQWWVYLDEDGESDTQPTFNEWMPQPDRRVSFVEDDPTELIPRNRTYYGPLAGIEPFNRLSTPAQAGEDYYTPAEIVDAARATMGNIDLDAASHWLANQVHRIPLYYHLARSAHENTWSGNVWLNPPYGDNEPWFLDIVKWWDAKEIKQLCMISPVWSFTTQMARPIIKRSSAMILLTPTPEFWGSPKKNKYGKPKTGTNHPHMVVYLGPRVREFRDAFGQFGIPFKLDLPDDEYDAAKDVAGCFEEGYRAIRERVAAGGPGWEPKS